MAETPVAPPKPLVLSIDDDPEFNKLFAHRLDQLGCIIETFTEPDKFIEKVKSSHPKLILIDINLGEGVSGIDLIVSIREELKSTVPIIVISGETDSHTVVHAIEAGANDYLSKPPFKAGFIETISNYLQTDATTEVSAAPLLPVPPTADKIKIEYTLKVEEVHPMGLTLLTEHLIRKGTSFTLEGAIIKELTPSCERLLVTAIGSSMKLVGDQNYYQVRVEVDPDQEKALFELKAFLTSKRMNIGDDA
jgi:DNA-binding response OmpR family regulator